MRRVIRRAGALPLLWQIFIPNAIALATAAVLLLMTPATISDPIALQEAVVIAVGLVALLAINMLLVRRALGPIAELSASMRDVDLLLPGQRVSVETGSAEINELRAAFNRMLNRLEAERRESGHRTLLVQEEERRRLARNLHDELNQTITGVMLRLDRITAESDNGLALELDTVRDNLEELTVEVENIVNWLRPETLDELGLISALVVLTDKFAERTDIELERRFAHALPTLGPDCDLAIYRIAQESLTNIAAHAGAGRVEIVLEREGNRAVRLTVTDDGIGIGEAPEGNGIRGMREWALLAAADLDIGEATPGSGTRVGLRVPVGPS
jgi:two-component system sensor histidine kinase UhpB